MKINQSKKMLLLGSIMVLMVSCAQTTRAPNPPNIHLSENTSLSDLLIWMNYELELSVYQNQIRESQFLAKFDQVAKELEKVRIIKAEEVEKSKILEAEFGKNRAIIAKKRTILNKIKGVKGVL